MRSFTITILLAFVARAHVMEMVVNDIVNTQDLIHKLISNLADKLVHWVQDSTGRLVDSSVDNMFDWSLKTLPPDCRDLDNATLVKVGSLVTPPRMSLRSLFLLHAQPHSSSGDCTLPLGAYKLQFRREATPGQHIQGPLAPSAEVRRSTDRLMGLQTSHRHQFGRQGSILVSGGSSGLGRFGKEETALRKQKKEKWEVGSGKAGAIEPEKTEKSHRWITEEDPTFEECSFNEVTGYVCKTPEKFQGTRKKGSYPGSSRVQFTLPDKDDEPLTIEMMHSRVKDNPSFGAVKVKLPIAATVFSKNSRLQIRYIEQGSNAENSMLRSGDIIRAISLPENEDSEREIPWWAVLGKTLVPEAEEGMVILDGKSAAADYDAALRENLRLYGKKAQVVLLIERPFKPFNDDDDWTFIRGFPARTNQGLARELVPIPVPVEDDPLSPPPRSPLPIDVLMNFAFSQGGLAVQASTPALVLPKASRPMLSPETTSSFLTSARLSAAGLARGRVFQQAQRDAEYLTNVGQAIDQLREDHQLIPFVIPGLPVALPTVKMEVAEVSGISFKGKEQYARFWGFFNTAVKMISTQSRSEVVNINQIGSRIRIRWRLLFTARVDDMPPAAVATAAAAAAAATIAAADAAGVIAVDEAVTAAAAATAAAATSLPTPVKNAFNGVLGKESTSEERRVDFNSIYDLDVWNARLVAHTLEFRTPSQDYGLVGALQAMPISGGPAMPTLSEKSAFLVVSIFAVALIGLFMCSAGTFAALRFLHWPLTRDNEPLVFTCS